jgi:hypothetical protein
MTTDNHDRPSDDRDKEIDPSVEFTLDRPDIGAWLAEEAGHAITPDRRCDRCGADIYPHECSHSTDGGATLCIDCYHAVVPPLKPADRAKEAYARGTQLLAKLHYTLAELAGAGTITHRTAMDLQHDLHAVWDELYSGTLSAVRNYDLPDDEWDDADNTYSGGSPVKVVFNEGSLVWRHNCHLLGEASTLEYLADSVVVINKPPGRYRGSGLP